MIPELEGTLIRQDHFLAQMNATSAYYPILIYLVSKFSPPHNILEIGLDQGYGAYYLARAAKEAGAMYYGVDIDPVICGKIKALLDAEGLPNKIICADTKKLQKIDFVNRIDLAFLDGEHNAETVLHEVELIYPLMPEGGWGYLFIHDIVDGGNAGAWLKLKSDSRFETLGFLQNYGCGVARKLSGLDYEEIARKYGK